MRWTPRGSVRKCTARHPSRRPLRRQGSVSSVGIGQSVWCRSVGAVVPPRESGPRPTWSLLRPGAAAVPFARKVSFRDRSLLSRRNCTGQPDPPPPGAIRLPASSPGRRHLFLWLPNLRRNSLRARSRSSAERVRPESPDPATAQAPQLGEPVDSLPEIRRVLSARRTDSRKRPQRWRASRSLSEEPPEAGRASCRIPAFREQTRQDARLPAAQRMSPVDPEWSEPPTARYRKSRRMSPAGCSSIAAAEIGHESSRRPKRRSPSTGPAPSSPAPPNRRALPAHLH